MAFWLGGNTDIASALFPKPVLGVLLLFEGLALLNLVRDMMPAKNDFLITLLVALTAVGFPYGYLIGMIGGISLCLLNRGRPIEIADPFRTNHPAPSL